MLSINWQLDDVTPAPRLLVLPPDAVSLDEALAAIELWEHYSGKTLDSTQRLAVFVMMAEAADGRWAASSTGREMPRQNGKGDEIEVVELWGLVQRAESILHTVHDAVLLASQAQQRMLAVLDHKDLRRRVRKKWLGTGQQMIEMHNGGVIWYRTRTGGGGRGVDDVSRLVVDEAQHATEEHLAAVSPTLLANSNPQLNAMGTSALAGRSAWWWGVRRRALSAEPGRFGYVGHTAEVVTIDGDGVVHQEPVDVADRALWVSSNPAASAGRGDVMSFLAEQFQRLSPESFAREHLGVWDPPDDQDDHVTAKLPADAWAATAVTREQAPKIVEGLTIAFDVARDGESACIAVGVGSLAATYVEVIEHRDGTAWLPARLVELVQRWKPIAVGCNGAGPAGAQVGPVLAAFTEAGIPSDLLHQLNAREYQQACGGFFTGVVEGNVTRLAGNERLDRAVAKAGERPLGDAWVWDSRSTSVVIAPLVAVTIARALLPIESPKPAPVFAY